MIYLKQITTPANTSASSPKKTVMKISGGLVYRLEIEFPPGPYGLLHCYIKDGNYQVWPSDNSVDFVGDNSKIAFDDLYLKTIPPLTFDIFTYNLDDTYEHTLIIRLGVVSAEIFMARFLPHYGFDHFLEQLKLMQFDQQEMHEEERQAIIANPLPWMQKEEED